MSLHKIFRQDRDNSLLDYPFDWTPWLTEIGDTIASYTLVIEGGGTISSDSNTDYVVTAWINLTTAVDVNALITLECRITTAGGRRDARTITIQAADL